MPAITTTTRLKLTNVWQKILDNQTGYICPDNEFNVQIYIGTTPNENYLTASRQGNNFVTNQTVWARSFSSRQKAILVIMK